VQFALLTCAVAVGRLVELAISRAHERRMARAGGRVVPELSYGLMVALHAGTLVAAPIESWLRARQRRRRRRSAAPRVAAGLALVAATFLRVSVLRALGPSWSTRVTRFPDGARRIVTRGPYRFVRHPNYAAVILELAALPLVGGAWLTALVATAANALVLARRIPLEERELGRDPRWRAHFTRLSRLLPRPRSPSRCW
jgi:methyltransferase